MIKINGLDAGLKAGSTKNRFFQQPLKPLVYRGSTAARLKRLLKRSKRQIPRGLKPARDDNNQGPNGTAEVVP